MVSPETINVKKTDCFKILNDAVDKLYEFRDYYVHREGLENAHKRTSDVLLKLEEVMKQLKAYEDTCLLEDKATYYYLVGKTLNITPDYDAAAEENLSKAVKLNPNLIDAWNNLGECYWKQDKFDQAKDCFLNALSKRKDKTTLRNLSIIIRKEANKDPKQRVEIITQSVKYARDALDLDPTDGKSWSVMGNAWIASYFNVKQSPKGLTGALNAYNRAEKDPVAGNTADLHFNRSVALKYKEEYLNALKGYTKAVILEPDWEDPILHKSHLLKYLSSTQDLIENKGRLKNKRLNDLVKGLSEQKKLGRFYLANGKEADIAIPFSKLASDVNINKVIVGAVVCTVFNETEVPFTFCLVDEARDCLVVTVYNLAAGKGVIIGDSVAVYSPYVTKVDFTFEDKCYKFTSIRVDDPRKLIINGKALTSDKISFPSMSTNKNR